MNRRLIHSVFENVVSTHPNATAVVYDGSEKTYDALNRQANVLARTLRASGVGRDSVVGLCMPNSLAYVTALLGVSKSGGVFMPIDLSFPFKRLSFILHKTTPEVLVVDVSQKEFVMQLIQDCDLANVVVIVLNGLHDATVCEVLNGIQEDATDENLENISEPTDGNYILFTSGSTGEPKAILGCHQSLSHFIHWEMKEFSADENMRVSQLAPTTFDVSLRDMLVPLLSGGTLCIPTVETRTNPGQLRVWLQDNGVTLMHCVPSIFRLLMNEIENHPETDFALQYVLLAGEPLYGSDVERWRGLIPQGAELVNLYGPSETTLAKVFNRLAGQTLAPNAIVPIGQPISNTAILILKDGRLCNVGEIGEICIKTPFRSKGYYNDPELTQQHFVQNPLTPEEEDIIYKTGDLGRYQQDRCVEILGRLDRQVKVNGIRIELGEVEEVVLAHPQVSQAHVIGHPMANRETMLVCYYTSSDGLTEADLRDSLVEDLPTFMIPGLFVLMDAFPMNLNGKIDRRALPKPEVLIYERFEYEPPSGETEEKLTALWREVLGVEKVGVKTPFLEMGGNSLNAISLLSKIYKAVGVEIGIKKFFEFSTVRELANLVENEAGESISIPKIPDAETYALSHAQRRLWVLDKIEDGLTAYNMSYAYMLEGELNIKQFAEAFQRVIQRHESLRSVFVEVNGEPRQKVLDTFDFKISVEDLQSELDADTRVQTLIREDANTPFDLKTGPLLRAKLLKIADKRYAFLFTMHHLISDGWSLDVLVRELMHFYTQSQEALPELSIQYRDYAAWQNELLAGPEIEKDQAYWHEKLSGDLPVLDLPTDFERPSVMSYRGRTAHFVWDSELTNSLKRMSTEHGVSLFMALMAGTKTLLYRYTGQEDILIGSPVAGRSHADLEDQIGLYVNTLVLRDSIQGTDVFADLLDRVKETILEGFEHQTYPFDRLVDELPVARDVSQSPLFNVMLALQNNAGLEFEAEDLSVRPLEREEDISRFDLLFEFIEKDDQLLLAVNYNTDLFCEDRIQRMEAHLQMLLRSALDNPTEKVQSLAMLDASERQHILEDFNPEKIAYPGEQSIASLFEAQANQTPDAVAVQFGDVTLTYRELNEKANCVANYLVNDKGVGVEDVVGVAMERSERLVVALLGILKAGAAYLPMDASWPEDRVALIVKDAKTRVIVTDDVQLLSGLSDVDVFDFADAMDGSSDDISVAGGGDQLCYVMYTSGSTGRPKGTCIPQRAVVRLVKGQEFITFEDEVFLLFAPISFDASTLEIWGPLLNGSKLVVFPPHMPSFDELGDYLQSQGVTTLWLTAGLFHQMVERHIDGLKGLRQLIAGGDVLAVEHVKRVLKEVPDCRVVNGYGPTESTTFACCHPMTKTDDVGHSVPIGRPIRHTRVYVLDDAQNVMPVGVPGELHIGGDGLARGYLNDEALTTEKFVGDPFVDADARMYKTGDLVCWREDGTLTFLGRKDDQVKIRGFRIEPGEVTQHLVGHPKVTDAVVVDWKNDVGQKELVAYVVMSDGTLDVGEMRRFLSQTLPDYMLPSACMTIDELPLTANGKVNRKALPTPERETGAEKILPRNETETVLAEVWREVLHLDAVGIYDDYFALGGDSIKAIQIASRLYQEGLKIEVRDLFQFPTISDLATRASVSTASQADQGPVTGRVPLTPIQSWFFDHFGHEGHFNQAVVLRATERLDVSALKQTLDALMIHHDALRLRYRNDSDEVIQEMSEDNAFLFEEINLDGQNAEVIAEYGSDFQARFNLEDGPLVGAVLFHDAEVDYLLVAIHHLAVDGVSWRVLMEDLSAGYIQAMQGASVRLPAKTYSFKDWAESIVAYSDSKGLAQERDYWKGIAGSVGSAQFEKRAYGDRKEVTVYLSEEGTQSLLTDVHAPYNTQMNDVLLTAFARALQHHNGNTTQPVMLEGHGRESIGDGLDVSRTVGWFTAAYPVLLDLSQSEDVGYQLRVVKEMLRDVPHHGVGYGVLRYISEEGLGDVNEPEVGFNYLGQFDKAEDGLFVLEDRDAGRMIRAQAPESRPIDVTALVIDGRLSATVICNGLQDDEMYAKKLADQFITELQNIIAHCRTAEGELSPSDIDYDVSIEGLDAMLKGLTE